MLTSRSAARQVGDVAAADEDAPARRQLEAGDQRSVVVLPQPRRAEQRRQRAARDVDADGVDDERRGRSLP